ncbi:MAG: 50S ribosomal protein L4 [Candidatus Cloacimonetes bacterium]|nr:50S ribosomal protein L4 [Candidatus Cloacimonadota bacterium]
MLKVNKYSLEGEEVGKISLPDSLFNVETKNPDVLLYEVINMYLANQRQGTSCVKNRGDVKGSSRKLFRQKGTGNARAGNLRTPLRVGGGVAFGPHNQDWYRKIPQKKKRLALKLALTQRAKENQVAVIADFTLEKPDTKFARGLLGKVAPERSRTLILVNGSNQAVVKSFSNLPFVSMDRADCAFAYEVLNCNFLLITEDALKTMKEVFGK